MIVRTNLILTSLTLALLITISCARPYKDSPIKTIVVPYQSHMISGSPYQFPKVMAESRNVLVPVNMDMVPSFNLDKGLIAMGSQKGMAVNFADGAYPVYYMPGNVNGRFNGKISLLA